MNILILMDMPLFPYRVYAYNNLAQRGYDLTVYSVSKEDRAYNIPFNFRHIRLSPNRIGPFIKLRKFNNIHPEKYDYIIVDPNLRVLDYYRFYNRKYWNKLIGWGHHKGCTTGNKFASWFRYHYFKKFGALVFYDNTTCNGYLEKGFPNEKLYVANNTQFVDNTTVKLDAPKKYFLYVGRIQDRKRIDMALKAFALLKNNSFWGDVDFMIVGGGDKSELQNMAANLGIVDKVIFKDATHSESELADIFNSAYAYVSPGHVGLGVLHSLAFGVPVITCIGMRHSVEISNCRPENSFVIPFDEYQISSAMEKIVSDKQLREKMSAAAYNYYNQYCTIDIMVDGIDNAIKYISSR